MNLDGPENNGPEISGSESEPAAQRPPRNYREAGVDIRGGDAFAEHVRSIQSPAVGGGIGGFSGAMPLDLTGMRRPLLVSTTDGVGTKLLVAKALDKFDTIGIDLVAMCVNDLAVCGARPLTFLDYIACGTLNRPRLEAIMEGIVRGCELAGATLSGGETAELPDMYGAEDFDLAGFAVGVVEEESLLPKKDAIAPGDKLIGVPSSGVHSNGLSLARKVLDGESWPELLTPTEIYVSLVGRLVESGSLLAAAHITGGGLVANTRRVLPKGTVPHFNWNWTVPKIFRTIQERGNIGDEEMREALNMGVGLVLVCKAEAVPELLRIARTEGYGAMEVGAVVHG